MTSINTQNLIDLTITLSIVSVFITALVMKSKTQMKKVPVHIKRK